MNAWIRLVPLAAWAASAGADSYADISGQYLYERVVEQEVAGA